MKTRYIISLIIIIVIIVANVEDIMSSKVFAAKAGQCTICEVVEDRFECWIFQEKGGLTCTLSDNGHQCSVQGICP